MNGFFRSVCGGLLLAMVVASLVGAGPLKKEGKKPAEIKLNIRVGEEKTKTVTISPGMSSLGVLLIAAPGIPAADDDPWMSYPAADGGRYLLLFSEEGTEEKMTGQLRASVTSELYAVVYFPKAPKADVKNGQFLYPKAWDGNVCGDGFTLKAPIGQDQVRVATVLLGMEKQDVKAIFPSATDQLDDPSYILYDWVNGNGKVLLVFSEEKDLHTMGGTKHVLTEILLRSSGSKELQYMMPREKRGKKVPEEYEKLLQVKNPQ